MRLPQRSSVVSTAISRYWRSAILSPSRKLGKLVFRLHNSNRPSRMLVRCRNSRILKATLKKMMLKGRKSKSAAIRPRKRRL